jgi:hypothetical protein
LGYFWWGPYWKAVFSPLSPHRIPSPDLSPSSRDDGWSATAAGPSALRCRPPHLAPSARSRRSSPRSPPRSSSSPAMDGDGFDLNSEASAGEGFPGLGLYGSILQGDDDEILPGRDRGSGLPPYRPPHAGAGDGRATLAQPFARQLNFGGSSSAATSRRRGNGGVFPGGSSSGAGGSVRQRANSAATAPIRRNQRTSTTLRGSGGQRVPHSQPPRAPRSTVRGQPCGSGAPFDNADEELEDDAEELASSGGLSVRQTNRAQWNDVNSACLLELCLELK